MEDTEVEIGSPGVTIPPVENVIAQARRNEELGYDSIWWPDHLMGWIPESIWTPDIIPLAAFIDSPHVFLETTTTIAASAISTQRIKLGTAVTEVIRRHPAVLAQTILTLDHISRGRLIVGLGAGEAENIVPYGLSYRNAVSRLEEALKIIRLLWSSREKISFNGRFWRLEDAVFHLKPFGERPPPIWLGAHQTRMLEITGRYGDGWLPTLLPTDEYRAGLEKIRQSAIKAERDPKKITPAMWTYVIVEEEEGECLRLLDTIAAKAMAIILPSQVFEKLGHKHPLGEGFYGLRDYIPARYSRQKALEAISSVPIEVCKRTFLYGTAEQIIKKIEDYAKIGLRHIVLWNYTFFCDPSKLRDSFKQVQSVLKYFKS